MRRQVSVGRPRTAGLVMVLGGLLLALGGIASFLVTHRGVKVMGASMEPTYRMGERLFTERVDAEAIGRGDVVLIRVPDRYREAPVLQRVVGTGGDHVVSDGTRITVNGRPADEPYATNASVGPAAEPYDVRVPEGYLFLLGDNRGNANDSRYFLDDHSGGVATSAVLGRVTEGAPPVVTTTAALGAALTLAGAGLWYRGRRDFRNTP
ncbi:signal peptidase I [Streptomyces sp. NPDC015130]|uniref:signal peptidase I n=1 Tax=Streptomyces sp. NPDC015130 TaxID=3364940 RepID=UPI0036FAF9D0